MRTPHPLVVGVALVGVALSAMLFAGRSAPAVLAIELAPPAAEAPSTGIATLASLPLPQDAPMTETPGPESSGRRVAEDPAYPGAAEARRKLALWREEFEAAYAGSSNQSLAWRCTELSGELGAAAAARFDELHADFEAHVRSGAHRARYVGIGAGSPFAGVKSKYCSARVAKDPQGDDAFQLLEFDPARDPGTARLHAEIAWLRGRLDAR